MTKLQANKTAVRAARNAESARAQHLANVARLADKLRASWGAK